MEKPVENSVLVAVTSRSFSKNPVLRAELLEKYKNVKFNDQGLKLVGSGLVDFLKGAQKAITALEIIDDSVVSQLPDLQLISKYGVGLDMIDLKALKKHGKQLGWMSGVNRRSVAELALSFALCLVRKIPQATSLVKAKGWEQVIGNQLTGKTFGLIGCGHIGKEMVQLLKPFQCRILAHDVLHFPEFYSQHGVEAVSLEGLLKAADLISLHVPLNHSTRGMLSEGRMLQMKQGSILINTARGELVDETALRRFLENGHLAGAGFDVFAQEPPQDHELLSHPNFLATPHIGGSSQEAILAMGRAAIQGLDAGQDPTHFE